MLSEPGASRSGNPGLVSSAKRRYLKLVIGSMHLWKERKGARLCGLVRTEETGPLFCLVKSHMVDSWGSGAMIGTTTPEIGHALLKTVACLNF